MNIFEDRDMRIMEPDEILFTRLINSTNSVESHFSHIDMDEEDFITILYPTKDIVAIDCNFGHMRWEDYDPSPRKKNTNKGRKPQDKPKSKRKLQGDGTCFNSNIQFTIRGSCIRRPSDVADTKVVENYIKKKDLGNGTEKIVKYYKIKLYRNGTLSVPGSLKEDLSDCLGPLAILEEYLREVTNLPVEQTYIQATMRNYKFQMRKHHIDLRALQNYFSTLYERVKLIRFEDVKIFLISPIFYDTDSSPSEDGWSDFIHVHGDESTPPVGQRIDYIAMESFLRASAKPKDMFVLIDDLKEEIEKYDLIKIYNKIRKIVELVKKHHNYDLGDRIIKKALELHLENYFRLLHKKLTNSKNNEISGVRYNPERFQGFIIRIKPMQQDGGPINAKESNITIKLYTKGKINIDNAKSPEEAKYIYYWLNDLFLSNEELIFDPGMHIDDLDPDDDWSYTDSDGDDGEDTQ